MKIRGVWGEFDAPYVKVLFICSKLNLREYIEFLIDTGASRTTIMDNDAIRLGIDYDKLEKSKQGTAGIGGVVDTYIIPEAILMLRTASGIHEERFDRIFTLKHKPRDAREENRIKRIPSLLGRDFLNKYSLFLNREKDVVMIEAGFASLSEISLRTVRG